LSILSTSLLLEITHAGQALSSAADFRLLQLFLFTVSKKNYLLFLALVEKGFFQFQKLTFSLAEPTWSDWSDWSPCEVNNDSGCGSGYQKQMRSCANPLPMYDGIKCRGPAKRLEKCFVMCPNADGVPSDPIPEKSNNDGKEIAP